MKYLNIKTHLIVDSHHFAVGDHVRIKGKCWMNYTTLDFKGTITGIHCNRGGVGNSMIQILSDNGVSETITLNEVERLEKVEK